MRVHIGNYVTRLVAFCSVLSFAISAQVELQLTTSSGAVCTRVASGQLCILKVVCHGQTHASFPMVAGLNAFYLQGRSKNMTVINGVYSTTYLYQLRAPNPGNYTFGPVHIMVDGVTQTSNIASVVVIDAQQAASEQSVIEKAPLLLFRLCADDTVVVVGQTVRGTLSLYCRADQHTIALDELLSPDWPMLGICIENREPKQSSTYVDGVAYTMLEWSWMVTPEKSGTMTIPACAASLRVPHARQHQHLFSLLNSFTQQRVYSNPVHITVKDLPTCAHPVHALGAFTAIHATLNANVMHKDDALVLQITITGKGEVKEFPLCAIPDALRWYDSKRAVSRDTATGDVTTLFEYVLQGLREGTWSIPEQSFYYYDTPHSTYKKLKTAPLFVTVLPAVVQVAPAGPMDSKKENQAEANIVAIDTTTLLTDEWQPIQERAVSVGMMLLYMMIPLVFFLLRYGWARRVCFLQQPWRKNKKYAFSSARRELQKAYRIHAVGEVYPIFLTLFSSCLRMPISMITQDSAANVLREAGMADEQQQKWNVFCMHMMSMTYAPSRAHEETFFKEALQWLDLLYPYL